MAKILTSDEEERSQDEIICTGHSEIDKRLGGGIPVGSLTLIEGQSDAGKSVLSQQMMWGALNSKHRVILFTTENTVKSMHSQMESLGLSILDGLLLGWVKIFQVEPSKMKTMNSFETIINGIKAYPTFKLIIVDRKSVV